MIKSRNEIFELISVVDSIKTQVQKNLSQLTIAENQAAAAFSKLS